MVLNWKIWQNHETHREIAEIYDELWGKADSYACENLHGEEAEYFYSVTD